MSYRTTQFKIMSYNYNYSRWKLIPKLHFFVSQSRDYDPDLDGYWIRPFTDKYPNTSKKEYENVKDKEHYICENLIKDVRIVKVLPYKLETTLKFNVENCRYSLLYNINTYEFVDLIMNGQIDKGCPKSNFVFVFLRQHVKIIEEGGSFFTEITIGKIL